MAPTMKKSGAMEEENMMNTKRRLSTTKEGQTKWSINANYVENMATLHFHAACIIDDIKRCATLVEIMVIADGLRF